MADSTVPAVKVCGHMVGFPSDSESSSDEDDIELEFHGELACASSSTAVIENTVQPLAVEMNGIMIAGSPPTSNGRKVGCAQRTNATTNVAHGTLDERQPVDNAFGIAYKPCGVSSNQGYDLPAGPAFADEDEFEQEMGAEFRAVLGSSEGTAAAPTSSGMVQSESIANDIDIDINDFFDDEGNDCRARKEEKKASGRGTFSRVYSKRGGCAAVRACL